MAPFDSSPEFVEFASPQVTQPVTDDPVTEILTKARAYVAAGWCCEPFSIDAKGNKNFSASDAEALRRGVQFCAAGALWRLRQVEGADFDTWWKARALLNGDATAEGFISATRLNSMGQAAALASYDRAIAARKAELERALYSDGVM